MNSPRLCRTSYLLRQQSWSSSARVSAGHEWIRLAILLAAGDKSGVGQQRFYRRLIVKADQRFDAHLERIGARRR